MRLRYKALWLAGFLLAPGLSAAEQPVRVFAAASLTPALTAVAENWTQAGHAKPTLVFAGSSSLARQIEAGAPADLFVSADRSWMDYLQQRDRIDPSTRQDWLGNDLVLIAPMDRSFAVRMEAGFDLGAAFAGRLCTGEPGVVPVGTYAQQALTSLGWWPGLTSRVVGTEDVRTALAFVERGECAAGIVYATDAKSSNKVELLARFPASSHEPIIYPLALVRDARPETTEFRDYLTQSTQARAVMERFGFTVLAPKFRS